MHKVTTERIAARVADEVDRILAEELPTTTNAAVRSAVALEIEPLLRALLDGIEDAAKRERVTAAMDGMDLRVENLPQWAQDGVMALRRREGERNGG